MDAHVDHHGARFHVARGHGPPSSHGHDQDLRFAGDGLEVPRGGVAERDGRVHSRSLLREEHGERPSHDPAPSHDDDALPAQISAVAAQELDHAQGRRGAVRGQAVHPASHVQRVEPVDVLFGRDFLQMAVLVKMGGERQLQDHPMNRGVRAQIAKRPAQHFGARGFGQARDQGAHPQFLRGPRLGAHVGVPSGRLTHRHDREPRYDPHRLEPREALLHAGPDLGGGILSGKGDRRHGVLHVAPGTGIFASRSSATRSMWRQRPVASSISRCTPWSLRPPVAGSNRVGSCVRNFRIASSF